MGWAKILFSFRGRLNRQPYWIALIAMILAFAAAVFIALSLSGDLAVLFGEDRDNAVTTGSNLVGALFLMLAAGIVTWCNLAIGAKRLHDRNKSAWWLLVIIFGGSLFEFATLLGVQAVGTEDDPSTLGNALIIAGGLISLWFFIELGFFKGSQGPNRFGEDPLGAKAADASL